jgi:2'-5' RNA ligase
VSASFATIAPETFRAFVAIELPRELKRKCGELRARLEPLLGRGSLRWVNIEQIHLTLSFLGEVQAAQTNDLAEALRQTVAGTGAIPLRVVDLGFFPDARRPRVVWLGVAGDLERLHAMQARVEAAVRRFSPESADKKFTAHITIGRVMRLSRADADALHRAADGMRGETMGEWNVENIHLFKSVLGPSGAKHEIVSSAPI